VRDHKLLEGLIEGAKVKFAAQMINGQSTVTQIQPAK
jgi:Cu/Ag efflux protein CusF